MTVVPNIVTVIINDKYTYKRVRNIKHAWIFLTASTVYIRGLPQIYAQTSEKHEIYYSFTLMSSASLLILTSYVEFSSQ